MTEGTTVPSAAPPTDAFTAAIAAFNEAAADFIAAREKVDLAQVEQAAAINLLPEADRADMAQLEAINDRLELTRLGSAAFEKMRAADAALKAVVAIPAPTTFALSKKMRAVFEASWETGDHRFQLWADARRLADLDASAAAAWVDRWLALGGGFCRSRNLDGTDRGALRSIPMPYTWTPPAQQNPLLKPREWIVEASDHTGAVKVLEGFLSLVPGLSDAVLAVAVEQGLLPQREEASHAA